jgi:hypothetical protein
LDISPIFSMGTRFGISISPRCRIELGIPSNALPASGRPHAAVGNMASFCTRVGKFILARFVTIVGPSHPI